MTDVISNHNQIANTGEAEKVSSGEQCYLEEIRMQIVRMLCLFSAIN